MSSYELPASVTDPAVGPHVDGTVFRTLCENDDDRHCANIEQHSKINIGLALEEVEYLAHPFREKKKSNVPHGKYALSAVQ